MSPGRIGRFCERQPFAAVEPVADLAGDARGQNAWPPGSGRRLRRTAPRPAPASRASGVTVGQISISPASPWRLAKWRTGRPSAVSPPVRARSANTRSTASSTARVERNDRLSGASIQGWRAARARGGIVAAGLGELARIGALKTIDRLFLVADGEQRAEPVVNALAGEKLRRQRTHQRPLRRARILRLIDENMAQIGVQPEQHPGGGVGALEQGGGAGDQPVEIDGGALGLGVLVALDDGVGRDGTGRSWRWRCRERGGGFRARRRSSRARQSASARSGDGFAQRLGDEARIGAGLAGGGQQTRL